MLIVAAALAVVIGIAVGLFGGGGSILTTPLLVFVLGFDPKRAIASSLLVVAVTSFVALMAYARAGRVRWRTGVVFGCAGMVGAFMGGQVGSRLPGTLLLTAFAAMMAVTAVAMVRGRRQVPGSAHVQHPLPRILVEGAVVGFVTGLVGAGGGFLVVPALVLLGGLSMQYAVGTSLLVVAMQSSAAFLGYSLSFTSGLQLNPVTAVPWNEILIVTAAAVAGSLIGFAISPRIHPEHLRRLFGWFVLVMAFFVLARQTGSAILTFAQGSVTQALEVLAGAALILVGLTVAVRWPVKVDVADYDTTGAGPSSLPTRAVREEGTSNSHSTME